MEGVCEWLEGREKWKNGVTGEKLNIRWKTRGGTGDEMAEIFKAIKIVVDGIEIELQKYDNGKLEGLIERLRNSHPDAKGLYKKLKEELIDRGGLSLPTLIRLSKWCDAGGRYLRGQPAAQEVSKLLFGKVIPRLE